MEPPAPQLSAGGRIRPINRQSIHRICSGQVILDLSTAIKELIENALDAGATHIEVRLRDYGSILVEVADNGRGVPPADYQALTLKYHTSKITSFDDLTSVSTYGFRGEALSSLCAVSELSVVTRTADQAAGVRLEYDHEGVLTSRSPAPRAVGTTVAIKNLFATMPVRHKEFLRNLKREFTRAVSVLQAYALIATHARLIVTNQAGKSGGRATVFATAAPASTYEAYVAAAGGALPGCLGIVLSSLSAAEAGADPRVGAELAALRDNVVAVFGGRVAELLGPLVLPEDPETGLRVVGWVSRAGCGLRGDASRQYFFLNGRPVDLPKASRILNDSFKSLSSPAHAAAYRPMAILAVRLAAADVDINVTPDKRRVFMAAEDRLGALLQQALQGLWEPSRCTFMVNQPLPGGPTATSAGSGGSVLVPHGSAQRGVVRQPSSQQQQRQLQLNVRRSAGTAAATASTGDRDYGLAGSDDGSELQLCANGINTAATATNLNATAEWEVELSADQKRAVKRARLGEPSKSTGRGAAEVGEPSSPRPVIHLCQPDAAVEPSPGRQVAAAAPERQQRSPGGGRGEGSGTPPPFRHPFLSMFSGFSAVAGKDRVQERSLGEQRANRLRGGDSLAEEIAHENDEAGGVAAAAAGKDEAGVDGIAVRIISSHVGVAAATATPAAAAEENDGFGASREGGPIGEAMVDIEMQPVEAAEAEAEEAVAAVAALAVEHGRGSARGEASRNAERRKHRVEAQDENKDGNSNPDPDLDSGLPGIEMELDRNVGEHEVVRAREMRSAVITRGASEWGKEGQVGKEELTKEAFGGGGVDNSGGSTRRGTSAAAAHQHRYLEPASTPAAGAVLRLEPGQLAELTAARVRHLQAQQHRRLRRPWLEESAAACGTTAAAAAGRRFTSASLQEDAARSGSGGTIEAGGFGGGTDGGGTRAEQEAAAERELERVFRKSQFREMRVVGQFNLGFILARHGSDVFIVDQHAAAEKTTFEHLQRTVVLTKQPLLVPMVLPPGVLLPVDHLLIREHIDVFRRNGFDFVERRSDGKVAPLLKGRAATRRGATASSTEVKEQEQLQLAPQQLPPPTMATSTTVTATQLEVKVETPGDEMSDVCAIPAALRDRPPKNSRGDVIEVGEGKGWADAGIANAASSADPDDDGSYYDGDDGLAFREPYESYDNGAANGSGGELLLSSVPVSRATGQLGMEDVVELVGLLRAGEGGLMATEAAATLGGAGEGEGRRRGGAVEGGMTAIAAAASSRQKAWEEELRPSRVRAMLASRACRSSIMVGKPLSNLEMRRLLDGLTDLRQPWNCPHGRPTMRHVCVLPDPPGLSPT